MTSTKQFVCSGNTRAEERDSNSAQLKSFFKRGQLNGSTKYFYCLDSLRSVREVVDNSATIVHSYSFDPFGRKINNTGSIPSDFQFGGYYNHERTGLLLTNTRLYNATLGRWISRDVIAEAGGINLFTYVYNSPTSYIDPEGTGADRKSFEEACKCIGGTPRSETRNGIIVLICVYPIGPTLVQNDDGTIVRKMEYGQYEWDHGTDPRLTRYSRDLSKNASNWDVWTGPRTNEYGDLVNPADWVKKNLEPAWWEGGDVWRFPGDLSGNYIVPEKMGRSTSERIYVQTFTRTRVGPQSTGK